MSRPSNPHDKATCESFLKALKREEVLASTNRDFEDLGERMEEFIERYYNVCQLHSVLSYRSPEDFEKVSQRESQKPSAVAKMTFFEPECGYLAEQCLSKEGVMHTFVSTRGSFCGISVGTRLYADSDEGDRGSGLMVISIPGSM